MHLGLFAKCTPCWSVSVNTVDKSSDRTENCPVDSRIGVEKRDYHHLSRFEISGEKRISRHLSGWSATTTISAPKTVSLAPI